MADELAEPIMDQAPVHAPELEFTGERIVPGKTAEALFREHEERYVFAAQYVPGKDVLDVACGSGVGTSFLQEAGALSALGLDIDPAAVAYAKERYKNCRFAQCDATNLILPDGCVDVVVSFETLEHISDQRKFLNECRRVLRPGGLLICSTPNRALSRWSPRNPFHAAELYPREFQTMMTELFPAVEIFSQRNRAVMSYVPKKVARRFLGAIGLLPLAERILRIDPSAGTGRKGFLHDTPIESVAISAYTSNLFVQPVYVIAVAKRAVS